MTLWISVLAAGAIAAPAHGGSAKRLSPAAAAEFDRLSATFKALDRFSSVDGATNVVRFDGAAAGRAGLDAAALMLGRDAVSFSNAVVRASRTKEGLAGANRALRRYPKLKRFMELAAAAERDPRERQAPVARASYGDNWPTYYYCGVYWYPRPSAGKGWVVHWTGNPSGVLWSWGYHPTPGGAGGGWTRDQTHMPWLCGWGTYRDHAYIPVWNQIREQNYHGWWPRGEPNPELWRVGPWPYAGWPGYVWWWHRYH